METCKTFDTIQEASAFMLGYRMQSKKIDVRIDLEEPQTVLIDCHSDKAEGVYLTALENYTRDCEHADNKTTGPLAR